MSVRVQANNQCHKLNKRTGPADLAAPSLSGLEAAKNQKTWWPSPLGHRIHNWTSGVVSADGLSTLGPLLGPAFSDPCCSFMSSFRCCADVVFLGDTAAFRNTCSLLLSWKYIAAIRNACLCAVLVFSWMYIAAIRKTCSSV